MADLARAQPRDMTNAMTGFDRFCASYYPGETVLTRELATSWCGTRRRALGATIGAARSASSASTSSWPAWTGSSCRPHGSPGRAAACRTCSPMRSWPLFRAADSISPEYRSPFREYTIRSSSASSSARDCDARSPSLRRRDVDADNAMVMIERSKRNKDRRVPSPGTWPGCLAASITWRTCSAGPGVVLRGQTRPSALPSWLIAGYTCAASGRAGSRQPQLPTRCGTITPPAP